MSSLSNQLSLLGISCLFTVLLAAPDINASWGKIRGIDIEGKGGRRFSGYLGIPYAVPPVGHLRWKLPRLHPGHRKNEAFPATTLPPACPQMKLGGVDIFGGSSEDCLTLDVYVPLARTDDREPVKPVLVWIHGGGFLIGQSGAYRPEKLVADGRVIVVTIQYRLGALGFLATRDDTVPHNLGLWDQTLALEWVKNNIKAFGGDPETITIFGESAGGMSVGLHVLSPASKGLFKRAILHSGSPLIIGSFGSSDPTPCLTTVGAALDCPLDSFNTEAAFVECLRGRSVEEIINATSKLGVDVDASMAFAPYPDGKFLPNMPRALLNDEHYVQNNGINDLDIMVSFTNKEGAMLFLLVGMSGLTPEEFFSQPTFLKLLNASIKYVNDGKSNEILLKVAEFLYREENAGTNAPISIDHFMDMHADGLFYAPSIEFLRGVTAQPHVSGTRYQFVFDLILEWNKNGPAPGSHHGDDIQFLFEYIDKDSILLINKTVITAEEEKASDYLIELVTSFARTGNPGKTLSQILERDWPEFSEDEAYLSLTSTPSIKNHVFRKRMAFWSQFVPELALSIQRLQQKSAFQGKAPKEEL